MKFPTLIALAASFLSLISCADADYCSFVDTRIGSGGSGHVFVGANVPFGMVQLGPTSIPNTWDFCSGYHESDSTVIGFSHTHLSGAGMPEMLDLTVMPIVGTDLTYARGNTDDQNSGLWSYADRSREISEPGYYAVPLERYGIMAEMTATARVGLQRFTFPASEEAAIIFDMENGDGGVMDVLTGCEIQVISDTELRGWRKSTGWADRGWSREDNQVIYFAAEFSRPFDSFEMMDGRYGRADFVTCEGEQVMLKVALSLNSMEGAALNLHTEIPHWDFEAVRQAARKTWNDALSQVRIDTTDEEARKVFYTSLYHTMIFPSVSNDCNEEVRYTNFSLWDTYRAWSPLYTILRSDMYPQMMSSFLEMYEKSGRVPIWPMYEVETDCMIGNPGVIMAADAILKGIDGGVAEELYDAMKASVMLDSRWQDLRKKYGYIPFDLHPTQTVAYDFEYAIADAAVAAVAEMAGREDDHAYFADRGGWWKNHYDPETGFVRGKDSRGDWREPFNPYGIIHMADDYCEGTAWQYTWLVPHDLDGLVEVMGGRDSVVTRLDRLFSEPSRIDGETVDMTGMLGQYVHGNEPSHHIIYFYSQLGESRKAADLVRRILAEYYTTGTDGLCGNEDMGQMSAWYVLSSMGLYQVNPFDGRYWFGSPLFDEVSVSLPDGKSFTVRAIGNSDENRYIKKAFLDGKPYDKNYIDYSDIIDGGELVFYMTNL